MRSIQGIAGQLLHLIVDDWRLAIAAIAWLAIVWRLAPMLHAAGIAGCIGLFAGLGLILSESVWRAARHPRRVRPARQRTE
ncbi:MAG: hypothetical protein ACREFJ_03305 [Acetobacteraceae bacterium]